MLEELSLTQQQGNNTRRTASNGSWIVSDNHLQTPSPASSQILHPRQSAAADLDFDFFDNTSNPVSPNDQPEKRPIGTSPIYSIWYYWKLYWSWARIYVHCQTPMATISMWLTWIAPQLTNHLQSHQLPVFLFNNLQQILRGASVNSTSIPCRHQQFPP